MDFVGVFASNANTRNQWMAVDVVDDDNDDVDDDDDDDVDDSLLLPECFLSLNVWANILQHFLSFNYE